MNTIEQLQHQNLQYEPPRLAALPIHVQHCNDEDEEEGDHDNNNNNNDNAMASACKGSNGIVTNARQVFKSLRLPTLQIRRSKRSSMQLRWVIMILAMFIMVGNFYAFDIPAPLHQQLEDLMYAGSGASSSNFEVYFNLLYTVYSFPNIILPFIGGQYVDQWGAPFCLFLFTSVMWLGQALFATGAVLESWGWMLFGRFIFGFGGENIQVATGKLLSQWFSAEELSFAFGTVKPIGRLGSVISNVAGPMVANKYGTATAITMAVGITAIPVFLAYFMGPIDKEAQQRCFEENYAQDSAAIIVASLSRGLEPCNTGLYSERPVISDDDANNTVAAEPSSQSPTNSTLKQQQVTQQKTSTTTRTQNDNKSVSALADAARFGSSFWLLSFICVLMYSCVLPFNNIVSGLLLERNYFRKHSDTCVLTYNDRCTTGVLEPYEGNPSKKIDGDDLSCATNNYAPLLPSSLYIIFNHPSWNQDSYVYDSMDESVVNCDDRFWNTFCTVDFCKAETVATEKVGRIMSIPYIVASMMSPITGYWVGNNGHRASLIAGSMFLMIVVHLTLAFASSSPILPLIGQGMGYGIFTATIWSSVPLTVEEELVGTAYGVMTSIQNTGLALAPMFVAGLYSLNDESYLPAVELFFVICSSAGFVAAIYLISLDRENGGVLNRLKPKEDEEGLEMNHRQKMENYDDNRSDISSVFHELT
mmetsp:Transcript_17057/g.26610  ORF Transcript_17057/g.26610 Transcript_17057/m.26610 type:complete len:702 (-) Transcript_17057:403-2508(-)